MPRSSRRGSCGRITPSSGRYFFNFVAFLFFGLHVAQTIGTGIVAANVADAHVIFGALMGAITWNILIWWLGIPSSSSHALIGGLVGAGIAKVGLSAVVWTGLSKTTAAIVLSPLIAFALTLLLVLIVSWMFIRATPFSVDRGAVWEVVGIRGWRNLRLVQVASTGVGAPGEITP